MLAVLLGIAPERIASGETEPLSPAQRTFVEQLATARARTLMWREVSALPVEGGRTLGAWAAEDISRERSLRLWVRQLPRFGPPRIYSDGSCEVDVRLLPEELRAQLAQVASPGAEAARAALPPQLESAARRGPGLWATGVASVGELDPGRRYPGWEDVTIEGVELARRAAEADAIHALIEEAGRLKLTAARRLSDFLNSSEAVREAVLSALQKSARIAVESGLDQVASADASISMTELIRILTDVQQRVYQGDEHHAADFREMALMTPARELRATGLAAPPQRHITRPEFELIELDRPAWTEQTLFDVGHYQPLEEDAIPPGVAAEAARIDGMDRLRRQVEALPVSGGVTVEQLLALREDLKPDVVVFLSGARPVGSPETAADGTVSQRVELPLRRLWLIVRRGMTVIEVGPEELSAATQPATQSAPASMP